MLGIDNVTISDFGRLAGPMAGIGSPDAVATRSAKLVLESWVARCVVDCLRFLASRALASALLRRTH